MISKETILLGGAALIGLAGLAVLQFGSKAPNRNAEDRVMIQAETKAEAADAEAAARVQKVTGQLYRHQGKYRPEEGKPTQFRLEKFSPGAVYEIQFSNGERRPFDSQGYVRYTFKRQGSHSVRLYALYEGQEVVLDSMSFVVAAPKPKMERVGSAVDF
jgi:hypothetical protein